MVRGGAVDPEKGAQGFSLVVERGMAGFERGRQLDKIGLDAQDTAELSFTVVPAENLLGQEGMGFICLMQNLPQNGSRRHHGVPGMKSR